MSNNQNLPAIGSVWGNPDDTATWRRVENFEEWDGQTWVQYRNDALVKLLRLHAWHQLIDQEKFVDIGRLVAEARSTRRTDTELETRLAQSSGNPCENVTIQNHDSDPICGNCGKPKSEHVKQPMGEFCLWDRSETFTAEPSDATLVAWMREHRRSRLSELLIDWKRDHGHGG